MDNKKIRKIENLWSIVLIELTSCCNFSCSFCPSDHISRAKTIMPNELWRKILDELGQKKMTKSVFFHLLGEPLLHKDVFDAISYANKLGLSVSLYTNGALLDEKRGGKLLNVLKKGRIVLSMQDIKPDCFDQRAHKAISWSDYLFRLQNFIVKAEKKGVNTQIHCMVNMRQMGWNMNIFKEQKKIQKIYNQWCTALNINKSKKINIFNPSGSYPLGEFSSFFVKHQGFWDNNLIDNDMMVKPSKTGRCALMNDTFAILADGTCTFCCGDYEGGLNLGNAKNDSLEDIFYGPKSTEIREAEKEGKIINDTCKVCRGTVVNKKTGLPVLNRNLLAESYFLIDHFKRFGLKSSIFKTIENIKRRIRK